MGYFLISIIFITFFFIIGTSLQIIIKKDLNLVSISRNTFIFFLFNGILFYFFEVSIFYILFTIFLIIIIYNFIKNIKTIYGFLSKNYFGLIAILIALFYLNNLYFIRDSLFGLNYFNSLFIFDHATITDFIGRFGYHIDSLLPLIHSNFS